ncbi:MAG: GMC family oxidoreductase [Deltaproteobacteria bacterium]|nr:GMC family oxidoreductase [Deltaproteobacteria bacterium]MCW5807939.1 GMC family oxidoreductase [Deltaproteobacteria bacterium]
MAHDFDFVVIGSGFGGSVAACRLAEKGYSVAVVEMGKRWTAKDFPKTTWRLRRWIWRPGLRLFGFYNMRPFKHVMILCGNAVGGGSITYANTMLSPPDVVWGEGSWKGLAPWRDEMPAHYATARRMLGVTENRILGDADRMLKQIADDQGVGDTFYKTDVAVYFGEGPGREHADPYFGGAGPPRKGCIGCGGCMVGCRFEAKNTLDKNYLYLAEQRGAQVLAETRVVDLRPLGAADGSDGYALRTERSTAWFAKRPRTITAQHVVVAASALGTMDLLLRMKEKGALPALSPRLGDDVRTNSESILGVRFPGRRFDMSQGIAIGSGIHIDRFTHIEATRYSRGSDVLGLIATMLVNGRGWRRILAWMWGALRHPIRFFRAGWPFGFARQTLILLVMQTIDATLRFRLARRWFWPFRRNLATEGQRIPTNIPAANAFAERAAQKFGGIAITSTSEILFDLPMTAHCIGGCVMGADAERGVIDAQHRVFNYRNLYVVDGSAVGANLGVNPSLTICALAERAMTFIPNKDGTVTAA